MSTFFKIASDFIDRMSNPAYGVLVNEDYTLRFAELLSEKGGMEHTLRHEAERLTSVDALTSHGWAWFLGWANSEGVLLSKELLLDITDRWTNLPIQSLAIENAVQDARWERAQGVLSLDNFGNEFLSALLGRAVRPPEQFPHNRKEPKDSDRSNEIRTDRAERIFVALLDIELDVTLDAAATLLNHRWEGQSRFLDFYQHFRDGLEPDTQKEWDLRLSPPDFTK